jgi:hypothetical protein
MTRYPSPDAKVYAADPIITLDKTAAAQVMRLPSPRSSIEAGITPDGPINGPWFTLFESLRLGVNV